MNRVIIKLKLPSPFTLPINYNHILQGLVYSLLGVNSRLAGELHDSEHPKLFTYSILMGPKSIAGKRITFYHTVQFELSAVDPRMIETVLGALAHMDTVSVAGAKLELAEVTLTKVKIKTSEIRIRMLSPVEVHRTDENRKTVPYFPFDAEFATRVDLNFRRKWEVWRESVPETGVSIFPLAVTERDKWVTTFEGTRITAYLCEYALKGDAQGLELFYAAGLGDQNSQGFGMFEVL